MNCVIQNQNIVATINFKGAELVSLKKTISSQEYIWEGNPEFWNKHSPVLFPIVGALKYNKYHYKETEYELFRHGFASSSTFELIFKSDDKAIFSLKSSEETKKKYPFDFELQICYTLIEHEIQIKYTVINTDNDKLPFSIGGHPAFALPNKFENYSLEFNIQEDLECFKLQNELLTKNSDLVILENKKLQLSYSHFEIDALIIKQLHSKEITILENNLAFLKIKFNDFKNLGIWTKVGAPYICIEPWLGYADKVDSSGNIMEKEGILFLEPKNSFDCSFSIEVL